MARPPTDDTSLLGIDRSPESRFFRSRPPGRPVERKSTSTYRSPTACLVGRWAKLLVTELFVAEV